MRQLFILSILFLLIGCADNPKKEKPIVSDRLELIPEPDKNLNEAHLTLKEDNPIDTITCQKTALDFLKLANKNIQTDFFHQLDSIRKVQYSKDDQDTAIFVDLTPKLLDKFLSDLNKDVFSETGNFEKDYNFNIAPPKYTDSKACKDKISIFFDKQTCRFRLVICNVFFAEWCQESAVVYTIEVDGNKFLLIWRDVAG